MNIKLKIPALRILGTRGGEEQMVGWAGNANAKVEESRSKKLPVLKIAEKILRRILVAPFFLQILRNINFNYANAYLYCQK